MEQGKVKYDLSYYNNNVINGDKCNDNKKNVHLETAAENKYCRIPAPSWSVYVALYRLYIWSKEQVLNAKLIFIVIILLCLIQFISLLCLNE